MNPPERPDRADRIIVEISRLDGDRTSLRSIELTTPARVVDALRACPDLVSEAQVQALEAIDTVSAAIWAQAPWTLSVFGQRARTTDPLHAHDRIELLPGLRVDPKLARARRAEHRRRAQGERRWARDRAVPRTESV